MHATTIRQEAAPCQGDCRTARQESISVWSGSFDAIDHENVDGPSLRIQLEPELLLQRGEDRRTVRIDRWKRRRARRWWPLRQLIRCEFELEFIHARKPGPVHDYTADTLRQRRRQLPDPDSSRDHAAYAHEHPALRSLARVRGSGRWPAGLSGGDEGSTVNLRYTKLRPEPAVGSRHHEGVNRKLPALVVHDELEPLGQECPHHQEHRPRWTARHRPRHIPLGLCHDIEPFGTDPVRTANELEALDSVGHTDQFPERHIRGREPPPGCIPNQMRPSPDLFGLTEATSKVGLAEAGACDRALSAPSVTDATMTAIPRPVEKALQLLMVGVLSRRSF